MTNTLTPHVTQYLTERRNRGELAAGTVRSLAYWLHRFAQHHGRRPLTQVTRRAVERWMETIGHHTPGTRRNALSAVRGWGRWATDRGLISADPTIGIAPIRQPRAVPRAMPTDAVARLLTHAPDQRARAIIMLMVGLGLRCVEVSRLQVGDYQPGPEGTLRVIGKGGHERDLPVTTDAARVLDGYLATVGAISGPLIRSERIRGRGLAPETISLYVARWMAEAGVKVGQRDGRSAHALRHTCASDVLDGGADLRVVQEMLGHRHLATTSVYLRRANLGQLRGAMEGRRYRDEGGGDHERATERPHAPTGSVGARAA